MFEIILPLQKLDLLSTGVNNPLLFYLKLHERSTLLPSTEKQNIQTVYFLGVCVFLQLFTEQNCFI